MGQRQALVQWRPDREQRGTVSHKPDIDGSYGRTLKNAFTPSSRKTRLNASAMLA